MTSSMNLLSFSSSALVRSEYSKSIRLSLCAAADSGRKPRPCERPFRPHPAAPPGSRSGPGHRFLAECGFPLLNRRKRDSTGVTKLDSVMQTPFKPIDFLSRDIRVDRRGDGTILLQSN